MRLDSTTRDKVWSSLTPGARRLTRGGCRVWTPHPGGAGCRHGCGDRIRLWLYGSRYPHLSQSKPATSRLIAVDDAVNGELLEPGASRAFAVCDNQAAHVYVRDAQDIEAVRQCLLETQVFEMSLAPTEASVCPATARAIS